MKKLAKYLLPLTLLFSSTATLANECPDENLPRYQGNSDFSLERKITIGTDNEVKVTEWFLGRPIRKANQTRPSFVCQPKLLFTELLVKCNRPNECSSIAGLYQSFSENFHKYQSIIHDIPSTNYQAQDNYCPYFGCLLEDSSKENFYLISMLNNWQSNSKIFTQVVKDNRLSNKAAHTYIRYLGQNKIELSVQLRLDTDSNTWLINNVLEVKRHYDSDSHEYLNTDSVRFFGDERALFKGNKYWWKLYELGYGLSCQATQSNQPALSAFGNIISFTGNYNQCVIDTNHAD